MVHILVDSFKAFWPNSVQCEVWSKLTSNVRSISMRNAKMRGSQNREGLRMQCMLRKLRIRVHQRSGITSYFKVDTVHAFVYSYEMLFHLDERR